MCIAKFHLPPRLAIWCWMVLTLLLSIEHLVFASHMVMLCACTTLTVHLC